MKAMELKKDKVYSYLKNAIINGKYIPGNKLPREVELAQNLGVGRITLRASLNRLEQDGFINRIHGKGTFIAQEPATHTATATIMVVHSSDAGFELPWHYVVPEISRYAEKNNLKSFITTDTALQMFSDFEISSFVKANNVIGIVAVMNNFIGNELILAKLRAAKVPVVLAQARLHDTEVTGFAGITIQQKEGWDVAIAYLKESGHKNIAVIGNTDEFGFREYSRQEILACLKKNGANPNERLLKQTSFDKKNINLTVRDLFSVKPFPTAILCFSDFYAIYVYEALKEMNLRIPEDVAVMGTCGFPDAKLLAPPLSTIDYGYAKSAETAVEMLQHQDKWFAPDTQLGKLKIQPFKLRKRKSTEIK
ncbi:MAG: GntR family transcriptional regulator [Victivallaceae bacterium]